jgi:hypothetical protein
MQFFSKKLRPFLMGQFRNDFFLFFPMVIGEKAGEKPVEHTIIPGQKAI